MKRSKIVLIDWLDSKVSHDWKTLEEARADKASLCQSVGFVIADTSEVLTIALGISQQDIVMDCVIIPKGCVVKVREMRVK